ncbi:MAG: hypothetical protein ACSW8F_01460 [bacterium]
MSTKELLYVEDSLSHADFLTARFREAANQLGDPGLKSKVTQLCQKNQEIFSRFYSLV